MRSGWLMSGCAMVLAACGSNSFDDQPPAQTPDASTDGTQNPPDASGDADAPEAPSCPQGKADCDNNPANGCETDTTASAAHCGGCSKPCVQGAHGTPACMQGVCKLTCESGYADCDGKPDNGCEANTATDPLHCGKCDQECPSRAHADPGCESSVCTFTCASPWADCDDNEANGCEVDLSVDPAHCHACGTACPSVTNGSPVCEVEGCSFACNAGWGNCDGDGTNGCELDLTNHLEHCGACNNPCSAVHGTPSCAAGTCAIQCDSGWLDCDGLASTGCEVELGVDPNHCGWCGHGCGTASCTEGLCAPIMWQNHQYLVATMVWQPGYLYFTSDNPSYNPVLRVSTAGGSVVELVPDAGQANSLFVNASTMYWIGNAGTVKSSPLAGGNSKILAQGQPNGKFILEDGTDLYWLAGDPSRLWRVQKSGNVSPTAICTPPSGGLGALVDDASTLYFTDVAYDKVYSAPKSGGTATLLADNQNAPRDLLLLGDTLYWASVLGHTITKMPKSGGTPEVVTATGDSPSTGTLVTDGTYLYWAASDGRIRKAPTTGGEAMVLTAPQPVPKFVRVDDKFVYWVSNLTGEVAFWKVAK